MAKHVVLIHGLGRSRYSMSYMGHYLKKAGYQVHNFGYSSLRRPIADHADRLFHFTKSRVPPAESLNFVTHSLGGLVLRSFAARYCEGFALGRAIMLGPPNQGAQIARALGKSGILRRLIGPSFCEVREHALPPATDKLEVGIVAGGGKRGRGISPFLAGDNDGIVTVEETRLEGARGHVIIPALHSFMMYNQSIIRETLAFLESGRFSMEGGARRAS